jgi:hypothetical protein
MTTYRIEAIANLEAEDDDDAQRKLDAIAQVLADGDGELGYAWQMDVVELAAVLDPPRSEDQ